MKTPIPEKIRINHFQLWSSEDQNESLIEHINSLIDVLTEQQKEIEKDNKYFTRLFEELTECIQLIQKQVDEQPYTAMRSTGENRCSNPMPHEFGSLPCCEGIISIKPQEDIDKFVDYSIKKYGKTYKALGNSQEDVRKKLMDYLKKINNPHSEESWLSIEDQADKILAIVKGEV